MNNVNIPDAAYDAAEAAIKGYLFAESDLLDADSDAINAAAPIILTTKLTEIVNQLEELLEWDTAHQEDGRGIRAAGIGAAIGIIRGHIDTLTTD